MIFAIFVTLNVGCLQGFFSRLDKTVILLAESRFVNLFLGLYLLESFKSLMPGQCPFVKTLDLIVV